MTNTKQPKFKTIFALRIMLALKEEGIEPLFETNNKDKPGFKCWVYEVTPQFLASVEKFIGGK